MPVPRTGPLTDDDYKAINNTLGQLARLQQDLALAKSAGVPCEEHDQHCQFLQRELSKVKAAYFPDKP